MVQLMSDSEFASGGPQNTGLGGTASGFGQLAQVLAQAPMMRARAGYYGAETGRAQAQTQQLQQQMDVAQGRQDRIREAMAILSNPGSLHDPAVGARLSAIALADPEIAAHFPGLLAGVTALGALGQKYSAAERDALAAGTGVAAYGNTETGQGRALAQGNRNIVTTAEQQRLTDDNQIIQAVPPGAPYGTRPTSMSRGDAKAKGWTEVSTGEATAQATPVPTTPPGAPYATRPTLTPQGTVASAPPGTYGQPDTGEVTSGAKPVPVLTPTGPRYSTQAQLPGQVPVLGESDASGAVVQGTMFPGAFSNGPVTLPNTAPPAAPNAATPPPPPPPPNTTTGQADTGDKINLAEADTGDTGDQPPPAPGSNLAALMSGVKTAQATPNVPGTVLAAGPAAGTPPAPDQPPAQPQPQPGQPQPSPLGSAFSDAEAARLERLRQVQAALKGQPAPIPTLQAPLAKLSPQEDAQFDQEIGKLARKRYPLDDRNQFGSMGVPSEWGPDASTAIKQRAIQLYSMPNSPTRENTGASIQQAVDELQARKQIPAPQFHPQGWYTGDWWPGGGRNVVGLAQPQGQPGQGQPAQANQPPASNQNQPVPQAQPQMQTRINPTTGQRWGLINNQWTPIDNNNQPIQAQAQGQ